MPFLFLSTPSARRATWCRPKGYRTDADYFYPRPPRGGRQITGLVLGKADLFLSTPSARRATTLTCLNCSGETFLSTPSARRATQERLLHSTRKYISIHALREEGDLPFTQTGGPKHIFLSTPSARRATWALHTADMMASFLSTPSARRATERRQQGLQLRIHFYPRPPRGGRQPSQKWLDAFNDFYPRPPRGGRHLVPPAHHLYVNISIHALREEGDRELTVSKKAKQEISIHALREEGDFFAIR